METHEAILRSRDRPSLPDGDFEGNDIVACGLGVLQGRLLRLV